MEIGRTEVSAESGRPQSLSAESLSCASSSKVCRGNRDEELADLDCMVVGTAKDVDVCSCLTLWLARGNAISVHSFFILHVAFF